jgi:SAM-dependent methyltransferase
MAQDLTFAQVWDYYVATVYDRHLLVDAIVAQLKEANAERILDCACGTGFVGIDLRERGFDVACSDGSPDMLAEFRKNASARGVNPDCSLAKWSEMATILSSTFDYVMCRGNSLVYAASWVGEQRPAASNGELVASLTDIASMVKPGGTVHIDLPSFESVLTTNYPPRVVNDEEVRITERVAVRDETRLWESEISVGDHRYQYSVASAILRPADVVTVLQQAGFFDVREVRLAGERTSYRTLLAHKAQ